MYKKASEDLKNEHEAILFTLEILGKIVEIIKSNKKADVNDIVELIDFLKIFADKCHHGKEEGFYFPELEKAGIPKENGPIGVMLNEHALGRSYIKLMGESLAEKDKSADLDSKKFTEGSTSYIALLKQHIDKENNVLFPMGDEKLSKAAQKDLLEKFEKYEDEVIGKGKHEELHKMLGEFEKKYLG